MSTIGIKLLDRLEVLHGQNIVHCDLKPDNITIGKEDTTELYLIDFGLSQTITDADELLEPFKINHILGSFIFLSTSAHNGIVSFWNDIESLAYVLLYLLNGNVPWDAEYIKKNAKNFETKSILSAICDLKKTYNENALQKLPAPIGSFLAATQNMSHMQRPNYGALRDILK